MTELPDLHPDWSPGDGPLEGDTVCVSASTLADAPAKPQLEDWRAREGAERTLAEWGMLSELRQTDPDAAMRWIRDAAFHQHRGKLNARERGTLIHAAFESVFGGPPLDTALVPEYLYPCINQLYRWIERSQFVPVHNEVVVWREAHHVQGPPIAGRIDTAGTITTDKAEYQGLGLIDIKTMEADRDNGGRKRRPYPATVTLQMAAYFYADHMAQHRARTIEKGRARLYCFSEEERAAAAPAPSFDWCAVLLITPERAELYPVAMSEHHLEASLAAARLYWHQSSVKGYLGRSIMETNA